MTMAGALPAEFFPLRADERARDGFKVGAGGDNANGFRGILEGFDIAVGTS
jgi:hypothetical protein